MRLITYQRGGGERLGAWINGDQHVVDLARAVMLRGEVQQVGFASMQSLIEGGAELLDQARRLAADPPEDAVFPTKSCTLLAPLPRPAQLRDFLSFPEHVRGCRVTTGEWIISASDDPVAKRAALEESRFFDVPAGYFDFPVYYTCNRMSVIGPDADVHWPAFSSFIDYELEWAAVIGKQGQQISRSTARDHIFGYTILNDWSARDEQMKIMAGPVSLGPAGGKDFANTLGPCIVTADEIPDPYALSMTARVNGDLVSSGNTSGMHFRFEELIEHLTRGHAIYPGEVLGSGTVGGGCRLETRLPIVDGDVVELQVERIGTLANRIIAPHIGRGQPGGFTEEMMQYMKTFIKP